MKSTKICEVKEGNGSRTILLVVGDNNVRSAMCEFLSTAGFIVLSAAEGRAALDTLKERALDLVIMDLMLQGKSGLQTHREIISLKPGMKTLFVSGLPLKIVRAAGFTAPGLNILEQPFTPGELLHSIRVVLDA